MSENAQMQEIAFRQYCGRLAASMTKDEDCNARRRPSVEEPGKKMLTQPIRKELQKELGLRRGQNSKACPAMVRNRFAVCSRWVDDTHAGDSDGETLELCSLCRLPLPATCFEEKDKHLHAECLAQHWVSELQDEENLRKQSTRKQKQARREEYDIGWRPSNIPRNDDAASKLVLQDVEQGMVCLVHDESDASVRIASTSEPAAAINLEYFSLALQCRRFDGHEPYFSLEAIDPLDKNSMQQKVFEPAWLAGTSVGEILFQADYYLKELSMGECEQPVAGMKNCLDYGGSDDIKDWNAREWFFVKKAEMQLSECNVLIPLVKMGVEAREQVLNVDILEDAPITRQCHPMVKFAEAFTHNFDLIAERRSVVFHLRELAKASVLAKFMFEVDLQLEESWFSLGDERSCSMEVPQLWNERKSSQVRVEDGNVVRQNPGMRSRGIYGGVAFGLEKFSLGASLMTSRSLVTRQPEFTSPVSLSLRVPPARINMKARAETEKVFKPRDILQTGMLRARAPQVLLPSEPPSPSDAPIAVRRTAPKRKPGPPATTIAKSRPVRPVDTAAKGPTHVDSALYGLIAKMPEPTTTKPLPQLPTFSGRLQGVDLRLDQFDLSSTKKMALVSEDGTDDIGKPLENCTSVADLFWACLDDNADLPTELDKQLLRSLFNPALSDRRSEGDCFVPPDGSRHYMTKLRRLLEEEESLRGQRKDKFLAKDFSSNDPGTLFPSSWASAFEVVSSQQDDVPMIARCALYPRPEFVALDLWQNVLETSRADFDRTTEDGLRFRIYRLASLEIRTTQDISGEEVVGAVFSTRACPRNSQREANNVINCYDVIVKATEYVEAGGPNKTCVEEMKENLDRGLYRHYYVVFETETGHKILTEQLASGQTTWQEDPDDVDSRSSCAKVVRAAACNDGACVRDVKSYQESEARTAASQSACKWYARGVYSKACGQVESLHHQYRRATAAKRGNSNSLLLAGAPCID